MTVVLSSTAGSNAAVATSVVGDKLTVSANLTFSSTYKTGGEAELATILEALLKQQGRGTIELVIVNGPITHYPVYDYVNQKLQFIVASTGVELAEAAYPAGITGRTTRLYCVGR